MNKGSFNEELRTTWAKHERNFGHKIPPEMREHVQSKLRVVEYDADSPEALDDWLQDMMPLFKTLYQLGAGQFGRDELANAKPRTIRKKPLERRLYLVDFIASRNPVKKGRLRVDWKRTVVEWNKAQPLDDMTLPVLKAEYYHAIKKWPSATMQKLVASHMRAIRKMMDIPFDRLDVNTLPAILPRIIDVTRQLSDECDAMIQYYAKTDLPGRFLHSSIVHLIEMWNQYLRTLDRHAKKEVKDNER